MYSYIKQKYKASAGNTTNQIYLSIYHSYVMCNYQSICANFTISIDNNQSQ